MPLGSNKAALFAASAQAGGARGLFAGGEDSSNEDIIGVFMPVVTMAFPHHSSLRMLSNM